MSVAFWSAEVKIGKKTSTQPPEGYVLNLQNLALTDGEKGSVAQVYVTTETIEGETTKVLLATLRGHVSEQYQTSLVFGYDVPVQFQVAGKGSGAVHFSGYIQPGPMEREVPLHALACTRGAITVASPAPRPHECRRGGVSSRCNEPP